MKIQLLVLVFFFSIYHYAQSNFVLGKVTNEDGIGLSGILVVNINTDEQVFSEKGGNFVIKAKVGDELRLVSKNYERVEIKLNQSEFASQLTIKLIRAPFLIEEVKIGFQPTGNLKKDSKALEPPEKVKKLNAELNAYILRNPIPPSPVLQTTKPSTIQLGPNFTAGQVDVIKLIGAMYGLVKKAVKEPETKASYAEQQAFYAKIKKEINLEFYRNKGIDEFEFEQLLVFADKKFNLSKNYRNKFDILVIDNFVKSALIDFLKSKAHTQFEKNKNS